MRSSIEFALKNRDVSSEYIKSYSQETEDSVINDHISLYVNEFTMELGEKGHEAIRMLEEMAKRKKII